MNNIQLAKKYNPDKLPASMAGYYITEKLDGNRCIAEYIAGEWWFFSRSGNLLSVSFDMSTFDKNRIYDGEIISRQYWTDRRSTDFNSLNGLINSIYGDKSDLIFAVFDFIDDSKNYQERRAELDTIKPTRSAFVLPLLAQFTTADALRSAVPNLLDNITNKGGEGLIINTGSAPYQAKRTSHLLKVKNVYTMDLLVTAIEAGAGKCAGMVGALKCEGTGDDGKKIVTDIGSGFSDALRREWFANPKKIINKIVEISYFDLSQNASNKRTNIYSLRFPRFLRVRSDKTVTSAD